MEKKTTQQAPTTQAGEAAEDLILEVSKCQVCLVAPRAPKVYLCSNGHLLCSACRDRVKCCPSCRVKSISIRNRPLEEYLERLIKDGKTFPCVNQSEGCETIDTHEKLLKHEKCCEMRSVTCPGQEWRKCTWRGPYKQLVTHLAQEGCSVMVPLRDALKANHFFPEISNKSSIFTNNSRTIWRPTSYITDDGKVLAFFYYRREPNGDNFFTCHTFADDDTIDNLNVQYTIQSTPMPHACPTGNHLPDFLAPEELRPKVTMNHHNGIKITCPRAATLKLTIHGKEGNQTKDEPHQGYCFLAVSSNQGPNPHVGTRGEAGFQYKGKPLKACATFEEVLESGRFLSLKDSQMIDLKRDGIMFHVAIEFGAIISLRYHRPQVLLKDIATEPRQDPQKRKATEETAGPSKRPCEEPFAESKTAEHFTPLEKRCVTVQHNSIVINKIMIPWKRSSIPTTGDPSSSQQKLQNAPMSSVIPIFPTADFPDQGMFESIRRSQKNLLGN